MMNSMNVPSLADIAAVTGNNDSFGGNNGWWVLIILFALFGGWGNRGWGGYSDSGAADNYVLASDFSNIERKIDGVNNGLCDGFYAMNTGMLNGFNSTNAAIASGFAGVNNAICTLGYQNAQLINGVDTNIMQSTYGLQTGLTALGTQIQQCCCDNRAELADLKYTMATQTQAIMQNCNNNYRSLHDEMVASQIEAKNSRIAELEAKVARADLDASQARQNEYLINAIRPAAIPSYQVPNPYYGYGYQNNCCCNG